MKRHCFLILFAILISGCSRYFSTPHPDILYSKENDLKLDVYSPRNQQQPGNVIVFFHGGNWATGSKKLYRFLGRGMARKGIVAVIADYRLSPAANYKGMAMDAASAVKWVKDSIHRYGGDPNKIFVAGHSAGGQVAALISTDCSYFDSVDICNPIKGCVLIDPFGLDMYSYLKRNGKYKYDLYRSVFTKDSAEWKAGSPQYHLRQGMPPMIVFRGGQTYPNIKFETKHFHEDLIKYQPDAKMIIVPGKRHAGMIFSFANPRKVAYRQIKDFMKTSLEREPQSGFNQTSR
ncbi:MAG: alpha/beta hydrolase [Bacteroidia bacterium]